VTPAPALGIVVGGDLRQQAALARQAEEAGFESVWCAETARSAFVQAAVLAQATERILVGTAVALAFPRSPTLTAMAARDLAELSGGRFVLGLGTQVKGVMERRYGVPFEHPAAKVAEAVEVIRAVWAAYGGTPIDHRGRFYTVTLPPFPGAGPAPGPIPVYLAAVNERMIETAGRVADGINGHPMISPEYVRHVVRPSLEQGARAAGRDPGDVNVTTNLIVQVNRDREVARNEAALQLGFYATTRTYAPVLALHRFDDRTGPLRQAFARGDMAEMARLAMPMVDTFALAGTPDEARERLAAYDGLVDRVILGSAWVGPEPDVLRERFGLLLETFRAT
jgi:probable F420-dependent oxidoreductase